LSGTSGVDGDAVTVAVTAEALSAGNYYESIEIDAGDIMGSPDTCWVVLEVVANQPYLLPEPDSLKIMTVTPWEYEGDIAVLNAGVGVLNWKASVHDPWLEASRMSGLGGDTIHLTIDTTGLPPGLHTTWIDISDSASFNVTERVPFILDYLVPSADTIVIGNASLFMTSNGMAPISVSLVNQTREMWLPLALDTMAATIDSAVFSSDLPGHLSAVLLPGPDPGTVVVHLECQVADSSWSSQYAVADLWLTARTGRSLLAGSSREHGIGPSHGNG
jgi:hypothetical protein